MMKNKTCLIHKEKKIPCITKNPQGCITPHPNPGVSVIYMCPECWKNFQNKKNTSGYRW